MKTKGWNEEVAMKQTFKIIKMRLQQGREITKTIAEYREALSETPTIQEATKVKQYYQSNGHILQGERVQEAEKAIEEENSKNRKQPQRKKQKQEEQGKPERKSNAEKQRWEVVTGQRREKGEKRGKKDKAAEGARKDKIEAEKRT